MNIVLLGPPGAGKGTQAAILARSAGLLHLSSGDILRAERRAQTDLGRKAQEFMDAGNLVPDDLILSMMMHHIGRPEASRGFLLDGFPRTVAQAQGLDVRLLRESRRLDAVICIDVEDEVVVRRLTGRWSCPNCARVYHMEFSPPGASGVCDECGQKLARRMDDEPSVVNERLRNYHELTKPLIAYYRDEGVLRTVSGVGSLDAVSEAIRKACPGL
ncbi:MAG: adenylate kinase [Phycisphaerae bacterium]|nr:adenylate kinase [Phycisphaerae bacterium]